MSFWDYTKYAGPLGLGLDKLTGHNKGALATDYFDPGDILGKDAAKNVGDAGKAAQAYLQQLSDTAWQRQMQGLQLALGSMNNYSGLLEHIYGKPMNYYDPSQSGGVLGVRPGSVPVTPPNAPPPIGPSTGPATESKSGRGHF